MKRLSVSRSEQKLAKLPCRRILLSQTVEEAFEAVDAVDAVDVHHCMSLFGGFMK